MPFLDKKELINTIKGDLNSFMSCKRLEKNARKRQNSNSKRASKAKQNEKMFQVKKARNNNIFKAKGEVLEKKLASSECTFKYLKSLEDALLTGDVHNDRFKAIILKLKAIFLYSDAEKKKTIEMRPFTEEDMGRQINNQSLSACAIEIFRKYLLSPRFSVEVFREAFQDREIENFVAKIKTETVKARLLIARCVQILLIKASEYRLLLKSCIYNELVHYLENGKNFKCIDVLLELCSFYVIKDIYYDFVELHSFLINYILPMFTDSNAFCYREDITLLLKNICYCSEDLMEIVFYHFGTIFLESNTPTRTLIMEITFKVLNETYRDIYPYISLICIYINFALKEECSALISQIKLLFSQSALHISFKKNIDIVLPKIFKSLYNASRTYWNVEERGLLFEILYNIMVINKSVFDRCLFNYKKEKYGKYFDEKINEDDLDPSFRSKRRQALDDNSNERRKSVYDIEYEEHKRFKRI